MPAQGGVRLGGGTRGREVLDHLRVSRQPLLKAKPSNLQVPTASFSTSVQKVEFVTHEVKKAVLPVISIAALFLNRYYSRPIKGCAGCNSYRPRMPFALLHSLI